jgi:hypothetical protein
MSQMLTMFITMLVIIVVAGLTVTFVAFPHRGRDIPRARWLSDIMNKAASRVNTYSTSR